MSDTNQVDEKQIWGALFGVSSFLYRITESAPRRDPLRWHLQDIAVRLLRETSSTMFRNGEGDTKRPQCILRELSGVTELLRERPWASAETLQVLTKYTWHLRGLFERSEKLDEQVIHKATPKQKNVDAKSSKKERTQKISRRQDRIVDILAEVDGRVASASFFAEAFPGVTARTIRRDLQALVERGVVEQRGSGRGAKYLLAQQ